MRNIQIENTINELFVDSRNDYLKMMKGVTKGLFRPLRPADFKDVYLSISKEQGNELVNLITKNGIKNIVEFGTSFGISTLFLAQGALKTGGNIITTELIESKAKKAIENFNKAGVQHLIDVRIGDALDTLKGHNDPVDLLLLDGWKNLYLPIFEMLEPNFHSNTKIYVDNADMKETKEFLNVASFHPSYELKYYFGGKVVIISIMK